jgi:hypothetical protein
MALQLLHSEFSLDTYIRKILFSFLSVKLAETRTDSNGWLAIWYDSLTSVSMLLKDGPSRLEWTTVKVVVHSAIIQRHLFFKCFI